ncbi:transglycosylase domain-containing protein [uncultured Bacteroides sp.]|uniref:transglycosylase domain-containing protein n=1 Tax=uncultured Bacteroides sp. TaxID=162156 RepID=UPI00260E4FB9|nr:biosynthetic peptidoglycan transglycosylase [uncultured Bacteroides sp.]
MKIGLKRIFIGLVSLLILVGAGLFFPRGLLLRNVAGAKLKVLSKKYNLDITYRDLAMSSLSTVTVEGLSVVPLHRDTLLKMEKAEIKFDFWPMLFGKVSVRGVDTDGMALTFVKRRGVSNYEFLFRKGKASDTGEKHEETPVADYSERVKKALNMMFRLLPDNGTLRNVCVIGQRDSLVTSFRIPELKLDDSRFDTRIFVSEGDNSNRWHVQGVVNPDGRKLEGSIASVEKGRPVMLPYIAPHYKAVVKFDSIAFSLAAESKGSKGETLKGSASVGGLEVYHAALSADTIDLNEGKIDYIVHVGARSFELDSLSTIVFNRLNFHPYVRATKEGRWHFTASIHRPEFPAQDLFASLPAGLFRHTQGIEASGNLTYDLDVDIDFNNLKELRFSSDLRSKGMRLKSLGEGGLTRMNDEFMYTAYEYDRPVRTFAIGPSNPNFRRLDQISPLLQMAVMQSEDGSFFYHQGFYPGAIQEALAYDLEVGRFARGGSSITMQLVKNVFLNRHKNIARKLEEALIVWLIENQHLTSKERMYEVYMNIIEWGPLVYGAAEASHFYFSKEPSELTVNEAIFLASIIPRPKHFRWVFNPDATLKENQGGYFRLIAERLAVKGLISESEAENILPQVNVTGPARDLILRTDTLTLSNDTLYIEKR